MPPALCLSIALDDDGTAELFAEAESGRFRGAGSAWFNVSELAEFGRQLRDTYPIEVSKRIRLAGGIWRSDGKGLDRVALSIEAYPIGSTGVVGLRVVLASDGYRSDRPDAACEVALEIQTQYEPLRRLGQGIINLATGKEQAVALDRSDA